MRQHLFSPVFIWPTNNLKMINFLIANSIEEYKHAADLFKQYAAWLNVDLSFQNFEAELMELKTMYSAPSGGIILCRTADEFVACVAIRKINNDTAELKRMYVQPAYQGQGIAKKLLEKAIELAKVANYTCIRLDTLNYMLPAINLYKKKGFVEISAYYHNPNASAIYFELVIKS